MSSIDAVSFDICWIVEGNSQQNFGNVELPSPLRLPQMSDTTTADTIKPPMMVSSSSGATVFKIRQ
jgi:hypothetical protein